MAAGGDNALRSDFVGAARILSIATHKKEMEIVHADRAGNDRLEHHRERRSDLVALADVKPVRAASFHFDRDVSAVDQRTHHFESDPTQSRARAVTRARIVGRCSRRHDGAGALVYFRSTYAHGRGWKDRHR